MVGMIFASSGARTRDHLLSRPALNPLATGAPIIQEFSLSKITPNMKISREIPL